jgi:Tol biopolymer transport system component
MVFKINRPYSKEKTVIQFQKFEKITGIDFSDNGRTIVLSAIRKGQSDLYTFDIPSRRERQLTNDFYDDVNPRFVDYSSKVVFSSNRNTDSLAQPVIPKIYETNNFDIYQYDLESKNGNAKTHYPHSKYQRNTAHRFQ